MLQIHNKRIENAIMAAGAEKKESAIFLWLTNLINILIITGLYDKK